MASYPHAVPGLTFLLTMSWMYFLSLFCNVIFDVGLVFHCTTYPHLDFLGHFGCCHLGAGC